MDTEELLKRINKNYTNAKLAVLFVALALLILLSGDNQTFAIALWFVTVAVTAIIAVLTHFENK